MATIADTALLEALNWRYATKKFDPTKKISSATLASLKHAAVLAPSSYGLTPWKIIVVSNPAVRETLKAASWNQPQITDCSHLFVFAIQKDFGQAGIDAFIQRAAEVRHIPTEALAGYKDMMVGTVVNGPIKPVVNEWAKKQSYIALGTLLTAAALLGVDACPMEGFDPGQYDAILDLPSKGLSSAVLAAVGYRAADDKTAGLAKVRFEVKDVVVEV